MTTPHKVVAGRPRGLRFMVWAIGSVLCIMCIQLWVYERKWSEHHPDDPGTNTFKNPNSSSTSVDGLEDDNPAVDESWTLREVLDAVTSCASDPSAEVQADTAECLEKLIMEYPVLRNLQQAPGLHQRESSQQQQQHQRSSDKTIIEALENQIASLSDMLVNSTEFLELKDTRESGLSDTTSHWFMSSVKGPDEATGFPEEFEFPSELSRGRLLCFLGHDSSDGTKNKYGFAYKGYLPRGSTLLPGLTLVADNYWDYTNLWHGMSALVNFISLRARQNCVVPARFLLFHWGELVPSMGPWIDNVLHASFGKRLEVEKLDHRGEGGGGPVCLEKAIVNRRGLGRMSLPNLNILFDTIRCRTRKFCSVDTQQISSSHVRTINITLLLRSGPRAMKNTTAVQEAIARECQKVDNCHLEVSHIANLTFCEQVALMSRTDVLVSTHGAQLTNMMFMSKGSYIMEMMPKGWLEFAGVGQYIYTWLADWANLNHEGIWRDPLGPDCPHPANETLKCFYFFKDITVGHNDSQLADWTSKTLQKAKRVKQEEAAAADQQKRSKIVGDGNCLCDHVDNLAHASHVEEEAQRDLS